MPGWRKGAAQAERVGSITGMDRHFNGSGLGRRLKQGLAQMLVALVWASLAFAGLGSPVTGGAAISAQRPGARSLAAISLAAISLAARPLAAIDPRVWADTAGGKTASFIVLLNDQADLSTIEAQTPLPATAQVGHAATPLHPAAWVARGQAVVTGLRQAAARSQPGLIAYLDAAKAHYRPFWIVNAIEVEGDRRLALALAARPEVARLESNRAFTVPLETATSATLASQAIQPNLIQVNAPAMWAQGFTGQGMVFASADTGVEWNHPALITHYRGYNVATGAVDHNFNWWDAIPANDGISTTNPCGYALQAPCDDYDHGTHTTGIGVGDDGQGQQIGMAPGAKWIACRNMDHGTGRPAYYIACLQFFIAPTDLSGNHPDSSLRPDVINNSYACIPSEGCDPTSLHDAVEAVRAAGIFMAVSAGNNGAACSTVTDPPGLEANVMTVGAVGANNAIAGFSSLGPVTVDGSNRLKPNLVAPGLGIYSSLNNGGYGNMSGTSMSAPHVAGAVLLLWSALPALRHNVSLTESLLEESALHLTSSLGCGGDSPTSVPNNEFGYGLLNVEAAYQQALLPRFVYYFPWVPNG